MTLVPTISSDVIAAAMASPRHLDTFVVEMAKSGIRLEMEPTHLHTPGLYVRELAMPAGSLVVSRIHKTTHPFVITKGKCSVWYEGGHMVVYQAPFTGVTHAGTRRVLFMHEDTVWKTFHPTTETDPDKWVDQNTDMLSDMSLDPDGILASIHRKELECP